MKRDNFTLSLDLGSELIIDNFAGGGGTSEGLEQAFGRPVDIAINHDPQALAMHAANHPYTKHLCESVWDIDPIKVTNNQPVGLVWLSPDCKHFSKAKGGKPVEKKIRGLAWVTLRWAAKCKPRVIMLENVEEFKTWGPLLIDAEGNAKPDPAKKGKTFDSFVRQLRAHGYDVDYRELRASEHDTPTIRKRFFLVARRDGIAIQWPVPTHGAPGSIGVLAGKLLPHHTAAECIDWSIPCPSIFERARPLADATMRRIAKGIMRYVINSASPFIVGQGGPIYSGKPVPADKPFGTMTTENHRAVVVPTIVPVTHQGSDRIDSIEEPFRTITGAHRGEKALMAATLAQTGYGERPMRWRCGDCGQIHDMEPTCGCTACGSGNDLIPFGGQAPRALDIEKPLGTVVGGAVKHAVVSAVLVDAAHGEVSPSGVKRWGAGCKNVEQPLGTITAGGGNQALVSAFLAKHYTGVVGSDLNDPMGTTTSVDHHSLVTAFLTEHANASNQRTMPADEPLRTICAQVKGGHFSMVSAHITKFRTGSTGSEMTDPLPTITAGPKENPAGAPHALGVITSNLIKLRGTSNAAATDDPLGTISAQGMHHAEVRSFLLTYYGTDQAQTLDGPLATVTSHDRFGLVTIQGQDYQIVDIGLRMLSPRELYHAQGFPASYIIDRVPDWEKLFVDGQQVADVHSIEWRALTKSAQVCMCGNSVCPPMARALIQANFVHEREIAGVAA